MRSLLAILILALLSGCSDIVTTRFETLDDAVAKRAFDRGWLPPIMPASSRNIVERNDLDANVGTGSFEFAASERHSYVTRLAEEGATIESRGNSALVTWMTDRSRWDIELHDNGHARYRVRSRR
jgi:hypothetical protein